MDLKTLSHEELKREFTEWVKLHSVSLQMPRGLDLLRETFHRLEPSIPDFLGTVESFPDRNLMRDKIVKLRDEAEKEKREADELTDILSRDVDKRYGALVGQCILSAYHAYKKVLTLFDDAIAKDPQPTGDLGALLDKLEGVSYYKKWPLLQALRTAVASMQADNDRLRGLLDALCTQVEKSNAVDDLGHPLKNLQALHEARNELGVTS